MSIYCLITIIILVKLAGGFFAVFQHSHGHHLQVQDVIAAVALDKQCAGGAFPGQVQGVLSLGEPNEYLSVIVFPFADGAQSHGAVRVDGHDLGGAGAGDERSGIEDFDDVSLFFVCDNRPAGGFLFTVIGGAQQVQLPYGTGTALLGLHHRGQ